MAQNYPPVGFHFSVKFELSGAGDTDSRFQEVSGIDGGLETTDVREGGENRFTYSLPTRAKYSNLTLKRGLLTNSAVQKWCRNAIENLDIEPISIQVSLLNEKHEPSIPARRWGFRPKKWRISSFNAEENRIVVESMELVYQYFRIA